MSREIDFTIVTPSYNYHQYIREMLDSVRGQEGVTLEHLVYDAGSTDGTLDIIREYDHVKLVVESDEGMSDAINKGFKVAKGKWVMWLNTDDRLKLGALRKAKEFADLHEEADVIYGAWDFINAAGSFQRRMGVFPFQKMIFIHHGCYIGSTSTFLRKKTILDEGHLLNIHFKYAMDTEYYARLAILGKKFVYMKCILADFRMHGENISQRNLGCIDVDGLLRLEQQRSEARSVRRAYGVTLFKSYHLNDVADCFLSYLFSAIKKPLRFFYQPK